MEKKHRHKWSNTWWSTPFSLLEMKELPGRLVKTCEKCRETVEVEPSIERSFLL